MGGFIILYGTGNEVVRASHYYESGLMNKKTQSFILWDTLISLAKLTC